MSQKKMVPCIVIEIYGDSHAAAVLTDDGVFAQVPLDQLPHDAREAGAVVELPYPGGRDASLAAGAAAGSGPAADTAPASRMAAWLRAAAAAAALLLVLWAGSGTYSVWAYPYELAVDVSPSLTLTLDRELRIHKAVPRNESGEVLLAEMDLTGRSTTEGVELIVAWAQRRSALEPQAVRVAIHRRSTLLLERRQAEVPASLRPERLASSIQVERSRAGTEMYVVVHELDRAGWEAARRAGISPNDVVLGVHDERRPGVDEVVTAISALREARGQQQVDGRLHIRTIEPTREEDVDVRDGMTSEDRHESDAPGDQVEGTRRLLPEVDEDEPALDEQRDDTR